MSDETKNGETVRELDALLRRCSSPADVKGLSDEAIQNMLALAVTAYVRRLSEGEQHLPPFPEDLGVTATEVVAVISEMLDFVDVEVFELGMWRSWGRV